MTAFCYYLTDILSSIIGHPYTTIHLWNDVSFHVFEGVKIISVIILADQYAMICTYIYTHLCCYSWDIIL